nr:HAD-IIIA family hydrolase [uncultured Schaedlerella sp.]
MKIMIMAGGKGTRIASINSELPKPMLPLSGKPVLEYEIQNIKEQGYQEIILVVGYLKHAIMEYFGDGAKWGMTIRYIEEDVPLGTGGALYYLKKEKEDILLLNGDIVFDIDIRRMYAWHLKHGGIVTLLTHPNAHPYDSGIIIADEEDRVSDWLHKEEPRLWYQNRVNAGIHMISPRIFNRKYGLFQELKKLDLDRDILEPLTETGEVYAYNSPEYVKDMGTPDRFVMTARDIQANKIQAKSLRKKQKAIFLDRDGTLNKYVGFLRQAEELELLPGVASAIRAMNQSNYLVIVVTNQPVIARGEVTSAQLREIHNKLETLLGQEGAYVDAIYYCPHHPDKGYDGEIEALKIDCDCRKPKPGMLIKAARDFNIDLSQSWMIGDEEKDMRAGQAAGCRTVFLDGSYKDTAEKKYGQFYTFHSLKEFTDSILEGGRI